MTINRLVICFVALISLSVSSFAQGTSTGTIKGQVLDDTGAAVPATDVRITGPRGFNKAYQTDALGTFAVPGLQPGNYTLKTTRTGFAITTNQVTVDAGKVVNLNIPIKVEASKQEVTVQGEAVGTVSVEASANASQLVLKQAEIDALPDDPDDLAADLQALAGPSAGPNGGQIYIDGFTGGQLPPKSSIREIRINQNPFSSEYDRLGFGRIEILTKPGTDRLRGSVMFSDSDGAFNSRNPFSTVKPDYSSRMVSANVGGPINKKTSYFIDFERRDINDNADINVLQLDPTTLQPFQLQTAVLTPNVRTEISPRIDYAINDKNTLVIRLQDQSSNQTNAGIGTTSLPTLGYNTKSSEKGGYVTETAILSPKVINETRFRFLYTTASEIGNSTIPTISVASAFTGGGNGIGNAYSTTDSYEIQNYTTLTEGVHAFKFGIRLRASSMSSTSPSSFNGSYAFTGSYGPYLNAANVPITSCSQTDPSDTGCQQLTSLQQYQRTLLFAQMGMSPAQIRLLGGEPNQYSVTRGDPYAFVGQVDSGLFFQDDWRVRQNLTLSLGLRWETQTNIHDKSDFAPRIAMAWSPDSKGSKAGKTVIRIGWGLFYDRFSTAQVLSAERYNGLTLIPYVQQFPNPLFAINQTSGAISITPDPSPLTAQSVTRYQIDPNLHSPYISQAAFGFDRQLPRNTTLSVNYMLSHGVHELLVRNINAPLDGTYTYGIPYSGLYPYASLYGTGVVNNYESTGSMTQKQLIVNVNSRISNNFSLFGYYTLGWATSNTDGASSQPMDDYNLALDYARASFNVRNRGLIAGSIATSKKYGNLRFSPFISARSGTPFDITVGRDLNGNTYADDRPEFAPAGACPNTSNNPNIKCTKYGNFMIPTAGSAYTPIPRNYGVGPANFSVNLRMSRTWGFGEARTSNFSAADRGSGGGGDHGGSRGGGGGGGGGPRGGGGGFGGGGGMRGGGGGMRGGGGDSTNQRYNMTLSLNARNLFNTVNLANPVASLSAPNFGESLGVAGGYGGFGSNANNRRIDMSIRFSF
ncbi:MAG TPA: carboxypeptidase regulatory-like domain-containing protein [Bryobacteraceae bacterium]